jgi:hypothetical protein
MKECVKPSKPERLWLVWNCGVFEGVRSGSRRSSELWARQVVEGVPGCTGMGNRLLV